MAGDASSEQEQDDPDPDFVELDPSGRYGRYDMMLGKGTFKFVYKAFDTLEGIEVAWNQMKLRDISKESDDLSEVRLLQTLKHKNIIKLYCSWVDFKHENINFITEIFTSGNLRQYREKHRHVELRALKNWARQILQGLLYLHSHDPPVIHRDLKCENIFVNGNHGEIKIGDLGLAALLYNSPTATKVIGTPEFMAPELYSENYNELVDIYAFGMCLLELMTFEYPYKECRNVAQIYKKVTSGIKPASLANVKDLGVKTFIEKCIADASKRFSARELLMDPFLQSNPDNNGTPYSPRPHVSRMDDDFDQADTYCSSPSRPSQDFTVQGHGKDANVVFLKLRIPDSKGNIHNINFPFDIKEDTSITVASEMVAELDLTDQDVIAIAEMIDSEVQAYVPDWSRGAYGDDNDNMTPTDDDTSPMNGITSPMNGITSPVNGVEHKPKVEESPFSADADDSPSGHVSEQLLFGLKYWSDSPKGSSGSSATSSPMSGSSGFGTFISPHHSIDLNERQRTTRKSGFLFDPHDDISFVMDGKLNDVLLRLENENLDNQNVWSKTSLLISTKPLMKDEDDDFKVITKRIGCLLIQQQKEKYELEAKHAQSITSIMKGLSPQLHTRILNWCRQKLPDPLANNEKFLRRTRSGKLRSTSAQYALPSYLLHSHMKNITANFLASQTNGVSSSFDINGGCEALKREPLSADRKGGFISRFGQNKANLKNRCTAVGIALILGD